jgi:hypothetical protein
MGLEQDKTQSSIDPQRAGNVTCESCGAEFTCSAGQETCWCFDVKVEPEELASIKENYKNCLCSKCLNKFNESRSDGR